MTSRAPPPGLAAPAGVALAVGGIATAALLLLAVGDAAGWLPHGATPASWSVAAWAALFLAGWTLMTGAMMLPSSLPFLKAVERVGGGASSAVAGSAFTAVWIAVGVLQWIALWVAGDLLAGLGPAGAERVAGASLIGAALYQVSPLASSCRRACASPFAILAQSWGGSSSRLRDAARAGLRYGVSCVGCCVPMIALMFVVGMHDAAWLLVLALLMVAQKHPSWGRGLNATTALAIGSGGVAILAGWWSPPLLALRALCGG